MTQLFGLPSMQAGRNGEGGVHAHHAGIEVEFGDAFKAACRALLDADAASFAVVDQNLIKAVRARGTGDAGLRTDQITVVAGIAGAATETAAGFLDGLLFGEWLNHFLLRL